MNIQHFMESYKKAWETSDKHLLSSLFTADGCYHNTPFSVQTGHEQIEKYWERTELQTDIRVSFKILHTHAAGGMAHWHTTYQVTSEEMFAIWAASNGTSLLARKAGDPLPRLALDGVAIVEFDPDGLCRTFRIWWHSVIER